MEFVGYKMTFDYTDWEQVGRIGDFWDFVAEFVPREKIVGLGWNWKAETTSFDYALGVIEDAATLERLKTIDFDEFQPELIKVQLPPRTEWKSFRGKVSNLREIYEEEIDPLGEKDFELEYIDEAENLEIWAHYVAPSVGD